MRTFTYKFALMTSFCLSAAVLTACQTPDSLGKKDPEKAKRFEALKAQIQASKDGSVEEEQAMVALIEAAGLASIVSDKSSSAGLLAQIKYGSKIKQDMSDIKAAPFSQDTKNRILKYQITNSN